MPPQGHVPCRRLRDQQNSSEITQLITLELCAPASSGAQETMTGRIVLTAGRPHGEPWLLTIMSPSQQWQGHHAQILRHLLPTQGSDTAPKPGPAGPFISWGNSTATACSSTARKAFPSPKNDHSTSSSAPSQLHLPLAVGFLYQATHLGEM